jgi:hypothetical protein
VTVSGFALAGASGKQASEAARGSGEHPGITIAIALLLAALDAIDQQDAEDLAGQSTSGKQD